MGAFRDFFTELWETYIRKPLDELKEQLDTKIGKPIKDVLDVVNEKLTLIKDGITDIPTKITELTDKIIEVKDKISSIADFFEEGKGESPGFFTWIREWLMINPKQEYLLVLDATFTVKGLDKRYNAMSEKYRLDTEIIAAYENKKEELTAQGFSTPKDLSLGVFGKGIKAGVDAVTQAAYKKLLPEFERLMEAQGFPEEAKESVRKIAGSGEFGLNAIISFLLGVTLYPAIASATAPVWRIAEHGIDAKIHSAILPPDVLLRGKWRGLIDMEQYKADMLKHGYKEKDIKAYEDVMKFYPAPTDLVNWQAKEVYEPDAIRKYGLDNEFENLELEPFLKAGMTEEQIKNYWRAHWVHASWRQVAEMLHRGQLTHEEVKDWFRLVEIPPFWREKFINISYNPVTRVDLRRLFRSGVYNREEVKAGYEALGSDPEIAEYLTQWTELEYSPADKELTKSEILKKYKLGEAESGTVTEMLTVLGYGTEEIEWIISIEDYKLSNAAIEEEANLIVSEVVNGTKTFSKAEEDLKRLNLPIKAKNKYISKIKSEVRKKSKKPDKGDLKRWFELEIITEEEFKADMLGLLYTSKDIERYIKEVTPEE